MAEKPELGVDLAMDFEVEVVVLVVQVCLFPDPVQVVVVATLAELVVFGGHTAVHCKFAGATAFAGAVMRWTGKMF